MCKVANCECEHISHFGDDTNTPNGYPGHRYAAQFAENTLVNVKLDGTPWKVCHDCAHNCCSAENMAKLGIKVEVIQPITARTMPLDIHPSDYFDEM